MIKEYLFDVPGLPMFYQLAGNTSLTYIICIRGNFMVAQGVKSLYVSFMPEYHLIMLITFDRVSWSGDC